jgi:hypothetical protein
VKLPLARERHHLETARIRQDGAIPADEAMKAARESQEIEARSQHQMVGIGENNPTVELLEEIKSHALDGAERADGHEGRRLDDPVAQAEPATPRRGSRVAGRDVEAESSLFQRKKASMRRLFSADFFTLTMESTG